MRWFVLAAIAELAGCYAIWLWAREGRGRWWIAVAVCALLFFAWALTRTPSPFAGRTFVAYGGVYLAIALVWGVVIDGFRPDRWDIAGACLALGGALTMLFAPRGGDAPPRPPEAAAERTERSSTD